MKKLYKQDSKGFVRVWWMELDGGKYRTCSGIDGGAIVESKWKEAKPKNVGRSNETSAEEQAQLEAESIYRDKLSAGGYVEDVADVGTETFFDPMLATRYDEIKNVTKIIESDNFAIAQPKIDGFRCTVSTKWGMTSRNGRQFSPSLVHVKRALQQVLDDNPSIVFDGELYNHDYHDDFNSIQSLLTDQSITLDELKKVEELVQYHVYDIFDYDQPDMLTEARQQHLRELLTGVDHKVIKILPFKCISSQDDLDAHFENVLIDGYEGQIVRLDSVYERGRRTKTLIKRKTFFDEEFEIIRFEEGVGNWAGCVKRVVARDKKTGVEFDAGVRGSQSEMAALLQVADEYVGGDCTIRYPNKTPAGKPRFGVMTRYFKGKRDI